MCAQCMAAAATTVGAASGVRAWIGARARSGRFSPVFVRRASVALGAVAVLAAGIGLGGA